MDIGRVEKAIMERHLSAHPFYEAWNEGKVSMEALQGYAQQYFHFVRAFPELIRVLQTHVPDISFDEHIAEEESHIALWAAFTRALQTSLHAPPLPETREFLATMGALVRKDFHSGCAALLAYEGQVSEIAVLKKKGLVEHYGLSAGLTFFDEHAVVDLEHQKIWKKYLEDAPEETMVALNVALDAQWKLLTGVQRAYC